MEEGTLFVAKMLTNTTSSGRRCTGEGKLDDKVNADWYAIGDETRSDA